MQTTYSNIASMFANRRWLQKGVMQAVVLVALIVVVAGGIVTATFAHAANYCGGEDATYVVKSGDTLGWIALRYHKTYQQLASYNRIPNANLIYVAQHICIPHNGTPSVSPPPPPSHPPIPTNANRLHGYGNVFPYPACTWWAAQRFYQLHGYFVPWTTNANAYEWTARAVEFGWSVSYVPTVGAIVDLQPWIQGAYGYGHVAVVERVLGNGVFVASNMSWGINPYVVQDVTFHIGYGVTFLD